MNPLLIPLILLSLSVIFYIEELTGNKPDGFRVCIYALAAIVACYSMGIAADCYDWPKPQAQFEDGSMKLSADDWQRPQIYLSELISRDGDYRKE